MDPVHREVLDTNHSQLVTSLRASGVMGLLLKDNVINKYDYDQMKRSVPLMNGVYVYVSLIR